LANEVKLCVDVRHIFPVLYGDCFVGLKPSSQ
jgi:hypothetical protein